MSVMIDAERLRSLTPWPKLIDALQSAFREPCEVPERLHFDICDVGSLIIMPAWHQNGFLGVKIVQVFPGNSNIGKPTVHGMYMLASASNGEVLSLIDAQELTARRTAATSALASSFLSRDSSRCLLIMGTGRLAFDVISAHATVRPIDQVLIWGRNRERASSLSHRVNETLGLQAEVKRIQRQCGIKLGKRFVAAPHAAQKRDTESVCLQMVRIGLKAPLDLLRSQLQMAASRADAG